MQTELDKGNGIKRIYFSLMRQLGHVSWDLVMGSRGRERMKVGLSMEWVECETPKGMSTSPTLGN